MMIKMVIIIMMIIMITLEMKMMTMMTVRLLTGVLCGYLPISVARCHPSCDR